MTRAIHNAVMTVKDAPSGYGWLSIGLHWFNAVAVVMLSAIRSRLAYADLPDGLEVDYTVVDAASFFGEYDLLVARHYGDAVVGARTVDDHQFEGAVILGGHRAEAGGEIPSRARCVARTRRQHEY